MKKVILGIGIILLVFTAGIFALDYFVADPLDNPLIEKHERIMGRYICP